MSEWRGNRRESTQEGPRRVDPGEARRPHAAAAAAPLRAAVFRGPGAQRRLGPAERVPRAVGAVSSDLRGGSGVLSGLARPFRPTLA